MDSSKLAIKFFIENPAGLNSEEFIPVFHRWIQSKALADHQLIDVADYGHVPEGPGTVLVSYEANIYLDLDRGRPGLLYIRKSPLDGAFPERLRAVVRYALECAALLESDEKLGGRVKFRTDEASFQINDRLLAPNAPETFSQIKGDLETFLKHLYGAPAELAYTPDPERLFEVGIRAPKSVPVAALLDRLKA